MSRPVPVLFRWIDVDVVDDQGVVRTSPAMVPHRRFDRVCARQYELGASYMLDVEEFASSQSRRHFFACLRSAWQNLPESIAPRYPSPEHLRKAALIKAGYRSEQFLALATREEALQVATVIKTVDEFAIAIVNGATVRVCVAQSQSSHAMNKQQFQESKIAVMDLVAGLVGVTAAELGRSPADPERDHARNPDHGLERAAGERPARPSLPAPAAVHAARPPRAVAGSRKKGG
jgi:hypothetical protein